MAMAYPLPRIPSDNDVTPIRLGIATLDVNDTMEQRWTLGPTWYGKWYDDVDMVVLPYGPDGDPSGPTPNVLRWAERAIAITTNYRVVGWDSCVPRLNMRTTTVEISTVDGRVFRTKLSNALIGEVDIDEINSWVADPDATLSFPETHAGSSAEVTTIIPVRAVTRIVRTTADEPVMNA